MFLQKQKYKLLLLAHSKKFAKNFPAVLLLVLFCMCALSAALYARPTQTVTPTRTQKPATKTHAVHHKATTTPAPAPAPATTSPQATPAPAPTPAPAKTSTHTAGTPKPEPVVTPAPGSNVSGLAPSGQSTGGQSPGGSQPSGSQGSSPPVTTGYTSTNWSGYLAVNGVFTGVSGSWTATDPTGNGVSTSADSAWIGIGGVTASDLIQIGTQNTVSASGQVSAAAFYELLPDYSQPVPGVTVSPGDSMTASILEISSGEWKISITDSTDDESYTATVSYDSSLSSAEWIEEDPSYSFGRQVPFDNFGEAAFTGASTIDNGSTLNLASSTAQPVTMVDDNGQTVAAPSAIGGDGASFTVTP